MKRYLVFVHETYEPKGGFHDYVNGFDNEGLALSCLNARLFELSASCKASGHVLDTETGKLIRDVEAEKRGR